MKKLVVASLSIILTIGFATTSFAENWLVRSKGKNVHTLWDNGAVTVTRGDPKTDYDQSEDRCHSEKEKYADECVSVVDLSEWTIIASGLSSVESSFLTFRNPENQREIVQVFFDRTSGDDVIAEIKEFIYSQVYGTRTETAGSIDDYTGPSYSEARLDR